MGEKHFYVLRFRKCGNAIETCLVEVFITVGEIGKSESVRREAYDGKR